MNSESRFSVEIVAPAGGINAELAGRLASAVVGALTQPSSEPHQVQPSEKADAEGTA